MEKQASEEAVRQKYRLLRVSMNEWVRRLWAADQTWQFAPDMMTLDFRVEGDPASPTPTPAPGALLLSGAVAGRPGSAGGASADGRGGGGPAPEATTTSEVVYAS